MLALALGAQGQPVEVRAESGSLLRFMREGRVAYRAASQLAVIEGRLCHPDGSPVTPIIRVPIGAGWSVMPDGRVVSQDKELGRMTLALTPEPAVMESREGGWMVTSEKLKIVLPGEPGPRILSPGRLEEAPKPPSPAPEPAAPPRQDEEAASLPLAARVSNVFDRSLAREVFADLIAQTGAVIIADSSVEDQTVSIDLQDVLLSEAMDHICLVAGLMWKEKDGVILVSTGESSAPLASEFSETILYRCQNIKAETLEPLLPESIRRSVAVDKLQNLLSINGSPRRVQEVMRAIRALDAQRPQILVEALITEVTRTKDGQRGFSFSASDAASDGSGGLEYGRATIEDIFRLKALVRNGDAVLRAHPSITATAGEPTVLSVGSDTYLPIQVGSGNQGYTQIQQIKTGVTLSFTALLAEDGAITISLEPEVSDSIVQINGAPTAIVRRASTTVRVMPGESVVIGGLMQRAVNERRTSVPVLGSLPLIGGLFRGRELEERESEIIITLTPRVQRPAPTVSSALP
jgi:type II secretory pathway component GspD/PulD (secretin)